MSGMATMSRTRASGLSEAKGSWNTGWISRARARRSMSMTRWPSTAMSPAVGVEQAQDQAGEGGLAAARFAHDAQHAAGRHGEGDVVDRDDMTVGAQKPALDAEGLADGVDLDGGAARSCGQPAEEFVGRRPRAWRGIVWAQVASAKSQRSRKAQPSKPGPMRGTVPGIEPSGSSRRDLARHRHAAQQALRVGMLGVGEQLGGRRALDHFAGVHHRDAMGDARDDAEIVGDQQHAEPEVALQARRAGAGSAPAP